MMAPELSRRLGRVMTYINWLSLDERDAFLRRVERCATFDDMTPEDRELVRRTERALKRPA